jgi:hypothetical protein
MMIETIPTIPQPLRSRLAQAAITLAQREAEKVVKRSLAAKGIKPQLITKREITAMAKAYLAEHPQLIAEAKPIVEQWRREGFFGKRAARTVHILLQTVITCPALGEVSQ